MQDLIELRAYKRLLSRMTVQGDCWASGYADNGAGYSQIRIKGKNIKAHRLAYAIHHGISVFDIPHHNERGERMTIDHVAAKGCTSRLCFNPEHLELVTQRENTLRGTSWAAKNAAKTYCSNGHELSGDNITPSHIERGWRTCLICSRARNRVSNAKRYWDIELDLHDQIAEVLNDYPELIEYAMDTNMCAEMRDEIAA